MKIILRILKWITLPLIVLMAILIIIPFMYEDEIVDSFKTEANANIQAKLNFESYELSLVKSFPDLQLSVGDLSIVGLEVFENDTLFYTEQISINLPLKSLWQDRLIINEIKLLNVLFNALVRKDGMANWDIMVEAETKDTVEVEQPFTFQINRFSIDDLTFLYTDDESDIQSRVMDIDLLFEGMMSERGIIKSMASVASIDFEYEGVRFMEKAHGELSANIESDSNLSKFTIRENKLHLNELDFDLSGDFAFIDTNIVVNVDFISESSDFKGFLSMIPMIYQTEFDKIKTEGNYKITGFAKGIYNDFDFPEIGLNINVNKAWFKYPDLKGKIDNIAMALEIRTGNTDNTFYNIKHLHLDFDENPIDMRLLVHSTDTDPYFDGAVKGKLDLGKLKSFIPLKEQQISGIVQADVVLKGSQSSLEKEQYEKFVATGNIQLDNIKYEDNIYVHPTEIKNASILVSPAFIDIKNASILHGRSDVQLNGRLDDFLAYYLKDEEIKANFKFESSFLNLDELFITKEEKKQIAKDSTASRPFEIPKNIDCKLQTTISELLYDKMTIRNINGDLRIVNGQARMDHLRMEMLGGKIDMSGTYTSVSEKDPLIDLDLNIDRFDFGQTFESFNTIQAIAPISKNFKGDFSMKLKLEGALTQEMKPSLQTFNGLGTFETKKLVIEKSDLFNKMGQLLKSNLFESPTLSKVYAQVDIVNGNFVIKPFDTNIGQTSLNIGGQQGLDKSLNYQFKFKVPSSEFDIKSQFIQEKFFAKAKEMGLELKLPETISFDVLISGFLNDPKLKIEYKEQLKNYQDQVKKVVEEKIGVEIDKAKAEAIRRAEIKAAALLKEADEKAKILIDEAEKRVAQLKNASDEKIDQLKVEADANVKKLVAAAGDNPFKKLAAEEAAKKILSETDKKVVKLKQENADKAQLIVQEAKNQASQIRSKAESEGQKLIEQAKQI